MKDKKIRCTFDCPFCGQRYIKYINRVYYYAILTRGDRHIQDVVPCMDKCDRESFISGLCDECQMYIFGE